MLDSRYTSDCLAGSDMNDDDKSFWFDFKKKKFLHNIDTFYYSVKFNNDFTSDSDDPDVRKLRRFFEMKRSLLDANQFTDSIQIPVGQDVLNFKKCTFAYYYSICLEKPEWFDIFLAPVVPRSGSGGASVTAELIVQIRSYMLWIYGVNEAFERSFSYVRELAEMFGLSISFAQENRVDYCWHSNYLSNPEKFFALDNFYRMRVDRFKGALTHTEKVGSEDYEIDYVALGKRSDKCFVRIYLKSKEVVEQGYKGWFFKVWLFHGLINRYDLYVYEECYKKRSWKYMNMARLNWYLEYGTNDDLKQICTDLISGDKTMEEDSLQRFADQLTPKVNLIMNVEYQTSRRHSKSYELLPLHDNSSKGPASRIYDYLDNRKLITEYLTHEQFRLVEPSGDTNKSRRPDCGFWKALRSCRQVDVKLPPKELKLVREYHSKLNAEVVKTRTLNNIITLGMYHKGINNDEIMQDVIDAICTINDNDVQKALRYKNKKSRKLNSEELPGLQEKILRDLSIIDESTGIFIRPQYNTDAG